MAWLSPAFPGLVERAREQLYWLCARGAERHVEYEKRDTADADLPCLQFVLADLIGVAAGVEDLADLVGVEPSADSDLGEHAVVEDVTRPREVGLVDRADQVLLYTSVQAKVQHAVNVEGVADRTPRVEAEPFGPCHAADVIVHRERLGLRLAELLAEHDQIGFPLPAR